MENINKEEVQLKFRDFLKKYGKYYRLDFLQYIISQFENESYLNGPIADIVAQVYSNIGILSKEEDVYSAMVNYIKKYYDINFNILEIACGIFPELGRKIGEEQTSGSITVMDPLVCIDKLDDLRIVRDHFTTYTDVSNYDLLLSHMPCEATIPIIEKANSEDKDLLLALCGCTHFPDDIARSYRWNYELMLADWLQHIEDTLKTTIPDHREFFIEEKSDLHYPLVRTRRK